MTLEQAVAAHRAGRLDEAERGYRGVLEAASGAERVEALQLLGVLMHRKGSDPEARRLLEEALQLDDQHAGAWANRGLVCLALQDLAEAEGSFQRALAIQPAMLAPRLNLARLLAGTGRGPEALPLLEGIDHPDALRMLGMVHVQAGELDAAASAWSDALHHTGDLALARALGQLALQRGRPGEAVAPLVLAYRGAQPVGPLLADALVQGATLDEPPVLARLLADPRVDAQRVERVVAEALREHSDVDAMASPLLRPWLVHTVVSHPDDRARLPRLRRLALEREDVGVAEALAVQAWLTEHAEPVPDDERARIDALPDGLLREALQACVHKPSVVSRGLPALRRVAVDEPAEEAPEAIEVLTAIDDDTSAVVAAMYEEHPYPRRVGVHQPEPASMARLLQGLGLAVQEPLSVLVAGAGTGQHPLQTVARYGDVEVLAVDLSRRSLARGEATARRHGLADRLRFAQADLLALDLPNRFDVIESVGVLHHLAEPEAGFLSLLRHLAPHGAMRIGLYSERGRQDVVAARALVAEWGLQGTPADLVEARRRLLALPDEHPARPVVFSPDFPSSTGLRDLVFHPMEHRYTPLQLAELLDGLGLRFLGFQHNRPEPARWYAERWPDDEEQRDLARWDEVEAVHPRAFSGMFVFWCAPERGR